MTRCSYRRSSSLSTRNRSEKNKPTGWINPLYDTPLAYQGLSDAQLLSKYQSDPELLYYVLSGKAIPRPKKPSKIRTNWGFPTL